MIFLCCLVSLIFLCVFIDAFLFQESTILLKDIKHNKETNKDTYIFFISLEPVAHYDILSCLKKEKYKIIEVSKYQYDKYEVGDAYFIKKKDYEKK